jgi:predicted dehydrogenase
VLDRPLDGAQVMAVASRMKSRAEAFADEFSIPRRYGSYDELIDDPDIDAVYIPLPQHLHCEYAIKSAYAGKHVLVEKPAALSVEELQRMLSACSEKKVVFMEAFMYRFKRIHNRVKEMIMSGAIGKLRYIDFAWSYNIRELARSPFRLEKNAGGGGLYDLGIYAADFFHFITNRDPVLLHACLHQDTPQGVDMFAHATCTMDDVVATFACGLNCDANYYTVSGELGSIYVHGSLSGRFVENVMQVHILKEDRRYEEKFPPENPYRKEIEHFALCIQQREEPMVKSEDSLRNIRLIEEIMDRAVLF